MIEYVIYLTRGKKCGTIMKKSFGKFGPKADDRFYDNGKLIPEKDLEHMVIFLNEYPELIEHLVHPSNRQRNWKLWQFDLGLFTGNIVLDESERPLPRREYMPIVDCIFPYNILLCLALSFKFEYELNEYVVKPNIKVIGLKFTSAPFGLTEDEKKEKRLIRSFLNEKLSKVVTMILIIALSCIGCGDMYIDDPDVDIDGPVQPYCFDSVESIEEYCHMEFGNTVNEN